MFRVTQTDSSDFCSSPADTRSRWLLSSSNLPTERLADVNSAVSKMATNLEFNLEVDIMPSRLEDIDEKLQNMVQQCRIWKENNNH